MSLVTPNICDFGWQAVPFSLADPAGATHTLEQLKGSKGTLVAFICNHCPYVKAIAAKLARDADELKPLGVNTIAIMANDYSTHPDDSPEKMLAFAKQHQFNFPYLVDETQEVARAWGAVCTPDFFGLNAKLELQYRGRLDESRADITPDSSPRELFNAMKQIAETQAGPQKQLSSMGCSIKWK